ncbi:MAG: ComEC/Rec2-related protein [bacterium]|jgi:ComEC/Rec2-related protein
MSDQSLLYTFKQPVFFFGILLVSSLIFIYFIPLSFWQLFLLFLGSILIVGLFFSEIRYLSLIGLICWCFFHFSSLTFSQNKVCQNPTGLTGIVANSWSESYQKDEINLIKVQVWCHQKQWKLPYSKIYLSSSFVLKRKFFQIGDQLTADLVLTSLTPSKKIVFIAKRFFSFSNETQEIKRLSKGPLFYHIQSKAKYYLQNIPQKLFLALFTADRFQLSKKWKKRFQSLGTYHLLAISGLHVGMLYFWIFIVGRLITGLFFTSFVLEGRSFFFVDLTSVILVFFYLSLIGMPITAQRAWLMLCCWLLIKHIFPWQPTWFIVLTIAVFFVISNPLLLRSVAFQLSFLSVFAILILLPLLPKISQRKKWYINLLNVMKGSIFITISILIFTFPISSTYFHLVSFTGVINNLIHISFVTYLVMPLGILIVGHNIISFYFDWQSGEFFLYSLMNATMRIWEKLILWNESWNHFGVWKIQIKWEWWGLLLYWGVVILIYQLLHLRKYFYLKLQLYLK